MIVIKFSVYNQRLRRITSGIIPSNAYGKLKFEFDFRTEDWDVIDTKRVNFYYRGANYPVTLDRNNQCFVPKPVINPSSFSVYVGYGDMITNAVRIPVTEKNGASNTPDMDDGLEDEELNILDGGYVTLYEIDIPEEDADNNTPDEDDNNNTLDEDDVVKYIMENNLPFYTGSVTDGASEVTYKQLNTATANYTDQGFYTTIDNSGKVTNAGYQITFAENTESIAQTFATYANAKIVAAYQYHVALNQWIEVEFDGTYWVESGTTTETINGREVTYTTYAYNTELMGDAITSPEYWRFEVEVL